MVEPTRVNVNSSGRLPPILRLLCFPLPSPIPLKYFLRPFLSCPSISIVTFCHLKETLIFPSFFTYSGLRLFETLSLLPSISFNEDYLRYKNRLEFRPSRPRPLVLPQHNHFLQFFKTLSVHPFSFPRFFPILLINPRDFPAHLIFV